jgi:tetratricopeptide (TPR) repeat protein
MHDGGFGMTWRPSISMPQIDRCSPAPAIEGTPITWAHNEPFGVAAAQPGSARPDLSRPAARSFTAREWLYLATLVAAVLLAYQPAWQGGLIWDDAAHVTKPELRSWHGLYRIWFQLGATQQYYPLLHSTFWVEHRLWGDITLGYHLVNILLHATVAVLVVLVLRRLAVPGAFLAAGLFALHPVHVESVAWITEQKNTLSAVFYLAAMLVYLRFDQTRKAAWHCGALGLFVLGLLSKTTAATLPAALLVIFWWQRGRVSWRRDVGPLLPFFALGAVAGVFTAWVERKLIGAEGAEFALSIGERCLIAGRAIWFYLGKLFWPAELIFIYPRWQVSPAVGWQYLFPAAALLLLVGLWAARRRSRAPLAAALFFIGTLFPALGFCNVFPFVYSFVADHFQYLASLGVITLVSAGAALLLGRWRLWSHPVGHVLCLALLVSLGALTWLQSRMYAGVDTLYRTTIERNPACWMAYNNLGVTLKSQGKLDEAMACFRKSIEFKPENVQAYNNLGMALQFRAQPDEAQVCYQKALRINPRFCDAYNSLGNLFLARGRFNEAMANYQKALRIDPRHAEAHNNLGAALASRGRFDEAIDHFQKSLESKPDNVEAHNNLGTALANRGRIDEAITHFQEAAELNDNNVDAHNNLGIALASRRQTDAAVAEWRKALELATRQHKRALAQSIRAKLQLQQAEAPVRAAQQWPMVRPTQP